jgi:hypothetical protein
MNITKLIKEKESEYLDFKQQYHDSNVDLIHDILCLSNSYHEGDRYLVFGIDDSKKIIGVENDPKRKTSANIQDLLRQSNFNRIPTIRLENVKIENHEIDILTITNRPDKPFFLLKDKSDRGKTIRNGVIYTRLGDTNTPLKETSPEANIELMWRERFGFDLAPLELAKRLLEEKENWIKVKEDQYLYHKYRPEFVIRDGKTVNANFKEPWTETFPDRSAQSFEVCVYYQTTILIKVIFVHCDGYNYRIPLPEIKGNKFFIKTNSLEWKIAEIYSQDYPLTDILPNLGINLV